MEIVKPTRVREFWARHARAKASLEQWLQNAKGSNWKNILDVRLTYRSADAVMVASGRTTVVFNIGGNNYRLITAIHFDKGRVYVLRFLTHAEYDKQTWKDEL